MPPRITWPTGLMLMSSLVTLGSSQHGERSVILCSGDISSTWRHSCPHWRRRMWYTADSVKSLTDSFALRFSCYCIYAVFHLISDHRVYRCRPVFRAHSSADCYKQCLCELSPLCNWMFRVIPNSFCVVHMQCQVFSNWLQLSFLFPLSYSCE